MKTCLKNVETNEFVTNPCVSSNSWYSYSQSCLHDKKRLIHVFLHLSVFMFAIVWWFIYYPVESVFVLSLWLHFLLKRRVRKEETNRKQISEVIVGGGGWQRKKGNRESFVASWEWMDTVPWIILTHHKLSPSLAFPPTSPFLLATLSLVSFERCMPQRFE